MVVNGDIITLSKEELQKIIDRECRKRLSISMQEFLRKRQRGELPKSIAVHDIEMLLKLV